MYRGSNVEGSIYPLGCRVGMPLVWSALNLKRKKENYKGLWVRSDHTELSLPYAASESDLSDFLVLNVQGELVRLFCLSRFITNSEDCPKVNIKIWNLDFTGQSHTLPVISEDHSSLSLLPTWGSVQGIKTCIQKQCLGRKEREKQRNPKYQMCSNEDAV